MQNPFSLCYSNSMMKVQRFLMTHSLADLNTMHGVKARIEGHKFSLNYDQFESKEDDKLAGQCRGLILRVAHLSQLPIESDSPLGETVVLARPFDRFFNLGQVGAAPVDFDHPETAFYEKVDGTLCIVYFDDIKGEWHVATRSVPEAHLPVDGFGDFTFRTLFEKALQETIGKDFVTWTGEHLHRDTTYMFELTTPMNRIVVDYGDYSVTLLGARKSATGEELHPAFVQTQVFVPMAQCYRFGSVSELVDFVGSRDPKKHEGIVVCDHLYRRVKVKNPEYLALNKVRDSVMSSPRGILELILLEKLDDALPLFPEPIQERALWLRDSFGGLIQSYRATYEACLDKVAHWNEAQGSKEHRKEFALAVQEAQGWMAPMMDQYQGRSSGLVDWIMGHRGADGGWSNSFLDSILEHMEKSGNNA